MPLDILINVLHTLSDHLVVLLVASVGTLGLEHHDGARSSLGQASSSQGLSGGDIAIQHVLFLAENGKVSNNLDREDISSKDDEPMSERGVRIKSLATYPFWPFLIALATSGTPLLMHLASDALRTSFNVFEYILPAISGSAMGET